jgi:hypothetical protein
MATVGANLRFISVTALLISFAASCARPPEPSISKTRKSGSVVKSPTNSTPTTKASEALTVDPRSRKLSSAEYRFAIEDLFAVKIDDMIKSHPVESTKTGFLNSVDSARITSEQAQWYADTAAAVASRVEASAPVLKGITSCPDTDSECLKLAIKTLAQNLYRRPMASSELDSLMSSLGKAGLKSYADSLNFAIEVMLQSPQFVFHIEQGSDKDHKTSYAVASKLASLFWQSVPDKALLDAAAAGELRDQASLTAQMDRMLSDPRAKRGLGQVASEWLWINRLDLRNTETIRAAGISDSLLEAMKAETRLGFARAALAGPGFLKALFSPTKTFLTPELSAHYGYLASGDPSSADKQGAVEVMIPSGSPRRGILSQAAFLLTTNQTSTTSVIQRGDAILQIMLCQKLPPPPPSVLDEAAKGEVGQRNKRELAEDRLANGNCKSCHSHMDPLGLPFENFDFIGKLRTVDENKITPNLASSFEIDGETANFANGIELSTLFSKSTDVSRCFSKQMLNYAFAGSLNDPSDQTLDRVSTAFAESNQDFKALMLAIIQDPNFLNP